jgi:xanthine dehydrogenase accessory factor
MVKQEMGMELAHLVVLIRGGGEVVNGSGDLVAAGEVVASVAEQPVKAEIDGVVRALLRNKTVVKKGTKLGEIDPSGNRQVCYTIRARTRAIAGGVLETILMRFNAC